MDVDALNENLRVGGALRLRHAMRPDEAFGMIVNFDGARRRTLLWGAKGRGRWRCRAICHCATSSLLTTPFTHMHTGIVADMNAVRAAAWRALAVSRDLPLRDDHLRHPELHSMPPEVAAVRMLRWADSHKGGR